MRVSIVSVKIKSLYFSDRLFFLQSISQIFNYKHLAQEGKNAERIYQYKDHLGNVRISFGRDTSGNLELVDVNDYYPFGMNHLKSGNSFFGVSSYKNYKYNGKELQETGMYDYGARFYMPDIGRWGVVDPLTEVNKEWSTYRYSFNNPIRYIDPDGKLEGDFISEDGTYLGNDGIDDKKVYVIKTTKTNFDSGAPSQGISNKTKKETEKFIQENSGKTDAFKANSIAYDNSVEIESSVETRQAMVNIVNQDDGKGGVSDANSREYGGRIKKDGTVVEAPPGKVGIPGVGETATISITTYFPEQVTFHDHPSGVKIEGKETGKWNQAPSFRGGDIEGGHSKSEYVFGRRDGTVYIYNNKGIRATIPQKYFVTPNKK